MLARGNGEGRLTFEINAHNRLVNRREGQGCPYNVKPRTRILILRIGWQLQSEKAILTKGTRRSAKVKYKDIIDRIGTFHDEPHNKKLSRHVVKRWWDKRTDQEFLDTAKLIHKKRTGRPRHMSFNTQEKIDRVIDYCLSLPRGYHMEDVYKKFGCSRNTLRKYTGGEISWRLPPKQEARDNAAVRNLRCNWSRSVIAHTSEFKNAVFVDHKFCHFYGLNRTHERVAVRKG